MEYYKLETVDGKVLGYSDEPPMQENGITTFISNKRGNAEMILNFPVVIVKVEKTEDYNVI